MRSVALFAQIGHRFLLYGAVTSCRGLAAVDYLMAGYHVWAPVIEALIDMGYDQGMLVRSWALAEAPLVKYVM